MKKLMTTMLAVAVGVGLHAAGMADTGTSFEGLDAGAYDITASTGELSAQEAGQTYWVTNGTETLTVVADVSDADNRPAPYEDATQTKYLSIKTTLGNPVTRNVSVGGTGTSIGDGFYFDSLVKFTAFEGDQQVDLNGGKLAIWLQENLDDGTQEPVSTNLVVTAGFLDGQGGAVATNYACSVPNVNLNDGAWHRVTVKAIADITNGGQVPGFVVFVDGERAVSGAEKGITASDLTTYAYLLNSEGSLFPSAVQSGLDKDTIAAVAFDGQGDVDDLLFTATAPDFAKDAEFFSIYLGEHVTSVQGYDPNGNLFTIAGTTNFVYDADPEHIQTVQILDCTFDSGWMMGTVTNEAGTVVTAAYQITAGGSLTVNAQKLGATVTIGGNATPYETLAAAMTAINELQSGDVTLTLNDSAEGGITVENENVSVVLDLAGNDITADSGSEVVFVDDDCTLLITNSTVEVGHVIADGAGIAAVFAYGNVTIAGGCYDGEVDFSQANSALVTGGSFSVNDNKDPDSETFPPAPNADLAAAVMTGYELEVVSQSSYYTLVEVVAPSIWTVTFLNDGDTYATVEVEDGQVCVLPEAPTKEHYTFAGWYPYNIGAMQPYDFTQPITADVTVEAHYTADTYTVSFDTAGGSVLPAIPDQSVAYNEYATDPNVTPVKVGYEFQYWSEDGSTEFDFVNTAIISNTTLTAIYDAIDYTITYMYGESALSGLTPATYTIQDAVTLPTVVDLGVVGVAFEAWTNAEGTVVANWAAGAKTGNQTFYAKVSAVTPPTKYEPGEGGITPPAGKTAAEFAADINANKANYIATPSTSDVADTAAYLNLIQAVADTEAGTVSIELTTAAAEGEQIAANTTAADIVSDLTATTVEIAAQPGLWYSISVSSTLGGLAAGEGTRVMATDSNVDEGKLTLDIPVIDDATPARFYRVNVNLADKPAPVPNP